MIAIRVHGVELCFAGQEGTVMRIEPLRVHVALGDSVADLGGDKQSRCGPVGTSRMLARNVAEAHLLRAG
jgi:hypothetical protein